MRRCERCQAPVLNPSMSREIEGAKQVLLWTCLNGHTAGLAVVGLARPHREHGNWAAPLRTCRVRGCVGERGERGYCEQHRALIWQGGVFDRKAMGRETIRLRTNGQHNAQGRLGVDLIREMLRASVAPIRHKEIRLGLCRRGMEKSASSVSAILCRLISTGEIERVGRGMYQLANLEAP